MPFIVTLWIDTEPEDDHPVNWDWQTLLGTPTDILDVKEV